MKHALLSLFICLFVAACGAAPDPRVEDPVFASSTRALDPTVLRVVSANLTSGGQQSYDEGPGARILHALAPDVALVQEMNASNVDAFVKNTFGEGFVFMRGAGRIPNGIVSRYPILRSGGERDPVVSDRDLTWAVIDLPGERDLFAMSLHLYSKQAPRRLEEATLVTQIVKAHVPANAYVVIGGDFNTGSATEACIGALADVVDTAAALPVDQAGLSGTSANRSKPLDRLLADKSLAPVDTRLGELTFASGLVVDTRVFTPLALLPGALREDSAAANMQHMAVVRDFRIEGVAPPPPPPPPDPETPPQPVFIYEYLANEPGTDTSLEYVTLENPNDHAIDLTGYALADRSAPRHVFAGELAAHARITVYGKDATTGTLALTNGGDTITLTDATGAVVDRVDYVAAQENVATKPKAKG